MKKAVFGAFFAALMISMLAAGGTLEGPPPSRVSLALSGNPATLDPHATSETLTFQVVKSVYDTLLEPNPEGQLVPALAESWSLAADNLSVNFKLRSGVSFHDGSSFDAADVKASLDRILDPGFASPNLADFDKIASVEITSPLEVRINLSEPNAPILYALASGWAAILPAEKIASGHNFALSPLGTGPFSFREWRQDESILLAKNEKYWQPIRIDEVLFRIVPESSLQIQGLLSGDIDIVYLVDTEDLPILEASGRVTVQQSLSSLVLVLAMNLSQEPSSDPLFRRAVAHAIDKQKVLDIAYGSGVPVGTFNDAGNAFYKDFNHLYPYDPDTARQLLASSSYDGSAVVMSLPQNYPPHVRAGEIYQEMLRAVGINVEIQLVDWAIWIGEVYGKANYQMTVIGHTGKLDPHGRFAGYGEGGMYTRWINPEVPELVQEASRQLSFDQRDQIYDRVQELFARDLPFFFLGSPFRTVAMSNRLGGFVMTPVLDTFDFRQVQLRQ